MTWMNTLEQTAQCCTLLFGFTYLADARLLSISQVAVLVSFVSIFSLVLLNQYL